MSTASIRVMVVDDHAIVRKGVRAFLAEIEGIEVVGDAGSGHEAIQLVESLNPDVILMDLNMPEMDGVQTTQQIASLNQEVRIVISTGFGSEEKLFAALKVGAHNYLMKDSLPEYLVRKIKDTFQGASDLNHSLARKLMDYFNTENDFQPLTSSEFEILQMLSEGSTVAEAAQKMNLSEEELRKHIFQIIQKIHQFS
jgi:two-component system, NarL family, response regulator LiaR